MTKGVIFDLDQTIVDSSIAEQYRRVRNWPKVYDLIPNFTMYEGFDEVFEFILNHDIKCCIVSSSPGKYVHKVTKQFGIPNDYVVDYFKTNKKKPCSEPMIEALDLMELSCWEVISFGDRNIDIISSNEANIKSVACSWGTSNIDELLRSNPNIVIHNTAEIIPLLHIN